MASREKQKERIEKTAREHLEATRSAIAALEPVVTHLKKDNEGVSFEGVRPSLDLFRIAHESLETSKYMIAGSFGPDTPDLVKMTPEPQVNGDKYYYRAAENKAFLKAMNSNLKSLKGHLAALDKIVS